ncbi:MAG: response regulator transcription factor [Lachnospiraceae bacterium]|nr:response regulator transcription factor [Lachnospiraceae bacterium]
MMRILLAEDEVDMSRAISAILSHQGYEVDAVYDGEAAVSQAEKNVYDCMIFDIMMPKLDGVSALKKLREERNMTPVLLLTAKAELDDRVNGLDAGADDYLTKPFAMAELLARVRSMVRRSSQYESKCLTLGSLTLNVEELEMKSENSIRLSQKESKLMEYLILNVDKEVTTDMILEHIWKDEEYDNDGVVFVYISYLRNKLQAIGAELVIDGTDGGSYKLREI